MGRLQGRGRRGQPERDQGDGAATIAAATAAAATIITATAAAATAAAAAQPASDKPPRLPRHSGRSDRLRLKSGGVRRCVTELRVRLSATRPSLVEGLLARQRFAPALCVGALLRRFATHFTRRCRSQAPLLRARVANILTRFKNPGATWKLRPCTTPSPLTPGTRRGPRRAASSRA